MPQKSMKPFSIALEVESALVEPEDDKNHLFCLRLRLPSSSEEELSSVAFYSALIDLHNTVCLSSISTP